MLEPLESEPFRTYVSVIAWTIGFGSHGLIYLLSIVGILLRPLSRILWDLSRRQPSSLPASAAVWCVRQFVVFIYPWLHLGGKTPSGIARTPFRPSRLLLIHMLWLTSSVGFWVGHSLYLSVIALNDLFPDIVGLKANLIYGARVPVWMADTILAVYASVFALLMSWIWLGSLRRSLAHFRHMNSVGNGDYINAAGHYLAPFQKATGWAFASLPIYIGLGVVGFLTAPWFQG